jgi:hypothetical protein
MPDPSPTAHLEGSLYDLNSGSRAELKSDGTNHQFMSKMDAEELKDTIIKLGN